MYSTDQFILHTAHDNAMIGIAFVASYKHCCCPLQFKYWFSNPMTSMVEGKNKVNTKLVRRLHGVIRPFILRRLKSEVRPLTAVATASREDALSTCTYR